MNYMIGNRLTRKFNELTEVKRRTLRFLSFTTAIVTVFLGCGPASAPSPERTPAPLQATSASAPMASAGEPIKAPLVRLTWQIDVGFLTPFAVSTVGPGGVVRLSLIYDTLTWKDDKGIIPWLAERWEVSNDNRTYTFYIRPGVKWHDGKPFTARDVQFSFDYYAKHPFVWTSTSMVEKVEAPDDRTAIITLKEPFAAFLTDKAGTVPIVPRHIWESVADPIKFQEPMATTGTGPYRLVSYDNQAGQYRFRANQEYWRGVPVVDEIHHLKVALASQILAVQNGDVDLGLSLNYDVISALAESKTIKVMSTEPHSIVRLVFNVNRDPLKNVAVRRAIAYALDRKRIAEIVTKGPAIVGSPGIIPPGTAWYKPDLKQYDYNPAQAAELLKQAGFQDRNGDGRLEDATGNTLKLDLLTDATYRDAELVKQMMEAVGIEVRVVTLDAKTRGQLLQEFKFDMTLTTHTGVGGDPDFLRRWFLGEDANAFSLGSAINNDEFIRLAKEQATTLDEAKRRNLVYRMQDILADELPTLPLYHRRFYFMYNTQKLVPFDTPGGLMDGLPSAENKLMFLPRR